MEHLLLQERLFQNHAFFVNKLSAAYDAPYTEKDHIALPTLSFPILSAFTYAAAKERMVITSSNVLFERADLDFEITKLKGFTSDTTVTISFSDTDNEAIAAYRHSDPVATLYRRHPAADFLLGELLHTDDAFYKEHLVLQLLLALPNDRASNCTVNSYNLKQIEAAKQYILGHFADQLTIAGIAAAVYLSPFYFCRLFKKVTAATPYSYTLAIRLEEAKKLLQQGETVTNTAYKTGFQSLDNFTHYFSQDIGLSPSQFRNQGLAKLPFLA